ncbi:DUF1003 domain-containing protein [Myroides ceti]|uniref:DUF1003 domain-containing protein n=1 Tax=Paenimyroides ceti TaxID=395087 RepID=A0ABT8D120_9FLAO|nr:DUF1003 domain-containing protein [Paenimyroides ceti]MDN3710205.1 DUF1003 domain-containing protein [Paenimyroides ceti]
MAVAEIHHYFYTGFSRLIVFNTMAAKELEFDPYPFILMNLVLSCIAALQAPIIMMSQTSEEKTV